MASIDRLLRSNLKLRHLQLLVALDQLRHLGRTAEFLSLTAPAVSKSLAEIERMVGFSLFLRSARGTEPTAHGEVVIAFARRVLADYAKAQVDLDAVSAGSVGRTHVGAMVVAIPTLLVPAVARMKQDAPLSTVLLEEGDLKSLLPRLRVGELDFVVGRLEPAYAAADLIMEPLYEDPSCCVVHASNPLAAQERISWEKLASCTWIMPQPWATLRGKIERVFVEQGHRVPVDTLETSSFLAVLSMLRASPAVALMPRRVAAGFEREGLVRILPVDVPFEMAPVGVISMADRAFSTTAGALLEHIRETGKQASL